MTLVISKGITLAKANNGIVDPDAIIYINNVEKADGENLEYDTAKAIHDFVVGCKADGIWNAIKASCILAGARTLTGALVPLVGAAPTNFNFVSADYNRKTGLVGDGSTKYLDSNRRNNADPQDSSHNAVYVTVVATVTGHYLTSGVSRGDNSLFNSLTDITLRNRIDTVSSLTGAASALGLVGHTRSSSVSFTGRANGSNTAFSLPSQSRTANPLYLYNRPQTSAISNARLAFYSIGESLDLALLDARVTDLINAFGAAIP
jgi:hypothetical protein